jgi:hypothetical protein
MEWRALPEFRDSGAGWKSGLMRHKPLCPALPDAMHFQVIEHMAALTVTRRHSSGGASLGPRPFLFQSLRRHGTLPLFSQDLLPDRNSRRYFLRLTLVSSLLLYLSKETSCLSP